MPVTKTAKRALRSSTRKQKLNSNTKKEFEVSLRLAKKLKTKESITKAMSLADRAAKKNLIHKNKASRLKSTLSKLLPRPKTKKSSKPKKA